ncbi:MAG: hypothetical protein ACE5NP_00080 [Anaerolineae bacterium]
MKRLSTIRDFFEKRPRLAAWLILAVGMVIMLLLSSKDVDLLPSQRLALVVSTIVLAGLCVWIIDLE